MGEVAPCVPLSHPFLEAVEVEYQQLSWGGGLGGPQTPGKKKLSLCHEMFSRYGETQDCNCTTYKFITRMELVEVSFWFLSGRQISFLGVFTRRKLTENWMQYELLSSDSSVEIIAPSHICGFQSESLGGPCLHFSWRVLIQLVAKSLWNAIKYKNEDTSGKRP